MFGLKTSIKTENITPAVIERWEKLYGKDLCLMELDGKKATCGHCLKKKSGGL